MALSAADQACEQIFSAGSSRTVDGRYMVPLPFSLSPNKLGHSMSMAQASFKRLENRLSKHVELREQYEAFLNEYLSLGHMAVDTDGDTAFRYYLPHHPVIRESSTTTKLRVVFNASAKTSSGLSLNDCLHIGPKLHQELPDVISRWRLHRFVCSADMEKMFRQILINPEDRLYQCILWRFHDDDRIRTYRLNTVTYGTASAPYLAMRVLKQLAIDEAAHYPLASKILQRDFYVDDAMFGADSIQECRKIRDELIALLKSGGISLRKWESNHDDLLCDFSSEMLARDPLKSLGEGGISKVLGISWSRAEDCFVFRFQPRDFDQVSRRKVLSFVASLFDPLGWIRPIVVVAKIFMQKLWENTKSWDEELTEELKSEWLAFYDSLPYVSRVKIPRWVGSLSPVRGVELHGFADASTLAYAAVVYLVVRTDSEVKISLLSSKTRVAPINKTLTVPRLELCAADLLSQLIVAVKRSSDYSEGTLVCWSDSSIVLSWLNKSPTKWKQFVANRVLKIQERLPGVEWRHVPTADNPADIASRGALAGALLQTDLWWHGPTWLGREPEYWPKCIPIVTEDSLPERRVTAHAVNVARNQGRDNFLASIANRFSSWRQLLNFTARVKFWMNSMTDEGYTLAIGVGESESFWLKHIQRSVFGTEISDLRRSSKIKALDPFLDEKDGVLRAGGRLRSARLEFGTRFPVLLPDHVLTRMIVYEAHVRTMHGGAQLMLRTLRERYWILRARSLVRSCISKCIVCVRHRARPMQQKMGDLPFVRVNPSRPFSNVGVDYAGPFVVRALPGRGYVGRKGWVSMFVCMSTRAVHLEFVSDCTSDGFIAVFKRFSARRGYLKNVCFRANNILINTV